MKQVEIPNQSVGMEAGGALAILIEDTGFDRQRALYDELRDIHGGSKRVSTEMGNDLPGDIKSARSALLELGLAVGEEAAPVLRDLVQGTTEGVRSMTEWAKAHRNLIKALGFDAVAVASRVIAAGVLAVVFSGAMMKIAAFRFAAMTITDGEIQRWGIPGEITFEIQLVQV